MSESSSCDDDLPKERAPASSHATRTAGDLPMHDKPPTFTSGCCGKHAYEVIQGFSEYKRWLISEIGIGWSGMLDVPCRKSILSSLTGS
jgi:hypothetical protein